MWSYGFQGATWMVSMCKSLGGTWLKGFLASLGSVYEADVVEFFANAKVIAGTIVSSVAIRKLGLSKEIFAEAFGLQTEGMVGFLDIPKETMTEMRGQFSRSYVSFRVPSKKKEMKMEFRLLHDIVGKALCAKAGSFCMVTSKKFDLMVAISVGLKKHRKKRTKKVPPTVNDQEESQPNPILIILAGAARVSTAGGPEFDTNTCTGEAKIADGPEVHERKVLEQDEQVVGDDHHDDRQEANLGCDTHMDQEGTDGNMSNVAQGEKEKSNADVLAGHVGETTEMDEWVDKDERIEQDESSHQIEKETATNDRVVRSGAASTESAQPQTLAFEFSSQADKEQAQARESDQRKEQIDEVFRSVVNIEGTVDEIGEHQAQSNKHQAHDEQVGETHSSLGGQQEQPSSIESPTQSEDPYIHNEDHVHNLGPNPISEVNNTDHQGPNLSNLQMVVYTREREENTRISFEEDTDSSHGGSQQVFVSSPPAIHHADTKLEEVERVISSLDSRIMSMDSRMISMDSELDELVNHLKELGDAKKGEGGQGSRPGEGSGRQGMVQVVQENINRTYELTSLHKKKQSHLEPAHRK
ncbi:hypothetical protein F511_11719 [Dorcoceras hygrometricum]|uniref:Uncharacterized protein n=1 Tax=Dorcoceras hygrometricum TaxID=472368 RepID=A0A2Z7BWV8_9LAMI|nr:hypothetical protein F511_11719 [Dorcoceras hygrometricum]